MRGKEDLVMDIEYKTIKDLNSDDLKRLFLSVNWESGRYPDKLVSAMKNSTHCL